MKETFDTHDKLKLKESKDRWRNRGERVEE